MEGIPLDRVLTLDGGFGTELENRGFKIAGDPLWSARALITNPDLVADIHKEFIAAGADVILTNSYHANIEVMQQQAGMTNEEAVALVKTSVQLAQKAIADSKADRRIFLAGSVGSYATTLFDASEYSGHYIATTDEQTMVNYFVRQSRPLLECGVDVLAFETVPALAEARCILKALDELPDCKAWISFSCKEGNQTNHGEAFSAVAQEISSHARVLAVGINCTASQHISGLLRAARNCTNGKPFVVYPNSGEHYERETGWSATDEERSIEEFVREWIALNAKVIGGCCRVGVDNIRKLAGVIRSLQ